MLPAPCPLPPSSFLLLIFTCSKGKYASQVCLHEGPVNEGEKSVQSHLRSAPITQDHDHPVLLRVISLGEGSPYETIYGYGDKMASSVENIDIPETSADFGDRVEDTTFLNALQNQVIVMS